MLLSVGKAKQIRWFNCIVINWTDFIPMTLEKFYRMMKSDLDICVCNPVTQDYTTFEILVQTENPAFTLKQSRTRRRFSDFCWLRKKLKKHHPLCVCPELPERKQFAERFEMQFLVQRMKELEDWLLSVTARSLYLSDSTLHFFLQTSLSCKQIEEYLKGQLSEDLLQQSYDAAKVDFEGGTLTLIRSGNFSRDDKPFPDASSGIVNPGPSSPVQIRNHPPALHNSQVRSDSGIAGFESGEDSLSDTDSSPSVSSALIPDKYPLVTAVGDSSIQQNRSEAGNLLNSESYSSSASGKGDHLEEINFDMNRHKKKPSAYQVTSTEISHGVNTDFKISVCSSQDCTVSEVNHRQSHLLNGKHNDKLENLARSEFDDSSVESSGEVSGELKDAAKQDRKKSNTHKVEMGVIFSVN